MIIDGKAIASKIQDEIKLFISNLNKRLPCLSVILVGKNPASQVYVNKKVQACVEVGMISKKVELDSSVSEEEILRHISILNADPAVDGILIQLPLPSHVNPYSIVQAIHPDKDVDGFHPENVGKLLIGQTDGFIPCTPLGIKALLVRSGVEIGGKHAVILGRSNIVGKPLAALLMQNSVQGNATVTITHSHTRDLNTFCSMADILIAAMGQPQFVKKDMIKDGAIVVDVGTNRVEDPSLARGYKIVGDVDFENVKDRCSLITPVPGGVGPMTIAMLLYNTLRSYQRREKTAIFAL